MEKHTVEHISSPEELDQHLVVVSTKGWLALILSALLVIGAILWSFFGFIPSTYQTKAIYLNKMGFEALNSTMAGKIKEIFISANDYVARGDVVMLIENQAQEIIKVSATQSGKVVMIFAQKGADVQVSSQLLLIQKEEGDFVFYSFVPIERGQQLKKGMQVYIKIEGIDAQQYGSLVANIQAVSPYVASEEELKHLLGSHSLIPLFTANQPVVIVIMEAIRDPHAESGFQWTSGLGPPDLIKPQTIGTALIILESRHPISYVFPLWRLKKAHV